MGKAGRRRRAQAAAAEASPSPGSCGPLTLAAARIGQLPPAPASAASRREAAVRGEGAGRADVAASASAAPPGDALGRTAAQCVRGAPRWTAQARPHQLSPADLRRPRRPRQLPPADRASSRRRPRQLPPAHGTTSRRRPRAIQAATPRQLAPAAPRQLPPAAPRAPTGSPTPTREPRPSLGRRGARQARRKERDALFQA